MIRSHAIVVALILILSISLTYGRTVRLDDEPLVRHQPKPTPPQQPTTSWKPPVRQGQSLKHPSQFLNGVNQERFKNVFEESYKKTRRDSNTPGSYLVGAGIADVMGQVAEIGFMGYASPGQKGAGLLQRPRARAFIFVDNNQAKKGTPKRVVYVSMDLCMVSVIL